MPQREHRTASPGDGDEHVHYTTTSTNAQDPARPPMRRRGVQHASVPALRRTPMNHQRAPIRGANPTSSLRGASRTGADRRIVEPMSLTASHQPLATTASRTPSETAPRGRRRQRDDDTHAPRGPPAISAPIRRGAYVVVFHECRDYCSFWPAALAPECVCPAHGRRASRCSGAGITCSRSSIVSPYHRTRIVVNGTCGRRASSAETRSSRSGERAAAPSIIDERLPNASPAQPRSSSHDRRTAANTRQKRTRTGAPRSGSQPDVGPGVPSPTRRTPQTRRQVYPERSAMPT